MEDEVNHRISGRLHEMNDQARLLQQELWEQIPKYQHTMNYC